MWAPLEGGGGGTVAHNSFHNEHEESSSDEAYLYSMRAAYNRALNLLHRSKVVGDADWEMARECLVNLVGQLSSILNSDSSSILHQECKHLYFMGNKNLARMQSKQGLGPESFGAAFLAALAAASVMADMGTFDAGLMFRTAHLALQLGDVWSCRLLLSLHRQSFGDLYQQALLKLEQMLTDCDNLHPTVVGAYWTCNIEWIPRDATKNSEVCELRPSPVRQTLSASSSCTAQSISTAFQGLILGLAGASLIDSSQEYTRSLIIGRAVAKELMYTMISESNPEGRHTEPRGSAQLSDCCDNGEDQDDVDHNAKSLRCDAAANKSTGAKNECGDDLRDDMSGAKDAQMSARSSSPRTQNRRSSRQPARKIRGDDDVVCIATLPAVRTRLRINVEEILFPEGVQIKLEELDTVASLTPQDMLEMLLSTEESTTSGSLHTPLLPPSTYSATNDYELQIKNMLGSALVQLSCLQADDVHFAFIRMAAQLISMLSAQKMPLYNSTCSRQGDNDALSLNLTMLALAVVKSWHAILRIRNFSFEIAFSQFNESERILLFECAAEFSRGGVEKIEYVAGDKEEKSDLSATANWLLNYGLSTSAGDALNVQSAPESIVAIRRIWLFLVHVVLDPAGEGDRGLHNQEISALLDFLKDWLAKNGPFWLHHMQNWGEVDIKHVSLLTAFLQESCYFSTLEKTHTYTHAWMDSVKINIEQSDDLTSLVTMSVRKKQEPEDSLLLLIFMTCQVLEDYDTWLLVSAKILSAFPIFFTMILQSCSEDDDLLAWTARSMTCIETTLNIKNMDNHCKLANALSQGRLKATYDALLQLLLMAFTHERDEVFSSSYRLMVALAASMRAPAGVVRMMVDACVSCIEEWTAKGKTPTASKMLLSVSQFASELVVLDAFTTKYLTEARLVSITASLYLFLEKWNSACPAIILSGNSVLLTCCYSLSALSPTDKLDMTKSFVDDIYANGLNSLGNEGMLQYFANILQTLVNFNDRCHPFSIAELIQKQQHEFCFCLGHFYYLLYGIPLVPAVSQDMRCIGLSMDNKRSLVDDVYRFYEFCVSIGHCGRFERRSCLTMLTQLEALGLGPIDSENFQNISHFLFGTNEDMYPPYDANASVCSLMSALESRGGNCCKYPMDAHSSIYFELLCQIRDGFGVRDKELREGFCLPQSSTLPVGERRLCQAIDLCVKDLVFSPRRYESWSTLHAKLIEYLQIVCDELSGMCLPDLLPLSLHEDLYSGSFTMSDLMSGSLRHDVTRGAYLRAFMEAQNRRVEGQQSYAKEIFQNAWAKSDDCDTAKLCLLLDFKNCFIKAIQRINVLLNTPSMFANASVKENIQASLNHGLMLYILAYDFPTESPRRRELLGVALVAFEQSHQMNSSAIQSQRVHSGSAIYAMLTIVKLRWMLYGDMGVIVTLCKAVRGLLEEDGSSRALWKSLRVKILNEVSAVLGDVALHLLSDPLHTDSSNLLVDLIDASRFLSHFQLVNKTLCRYDNVDTDASTAAENQIAANSAWEILLNCFVNFRECQRCDQYDFRSVYGISSLLHRLRALSDSPSSTIPTWVLDGFQQLHIAGATSRAALRELAKLFDKKRPQIAAMWFPEKPSDEWECVISRTYEFDHLRRLYFSLYTELLETCDDLSSSLNVLYNIMSSKNQTAALRWMLETAVVTTMKIVGRRLGKYNKQLQTVYEILQLVHTRVSTGACKRINAVLCALYGKCVAHHVGKPANLKEALKFCHSKWGLTNHSTPAFHKFGCLGKRGRDEMK